MGKGKGGVSGMAARIDVSGPSFLPSHVSYSCAMRVMKQMRYKLNAKLCVLPIRQVDFTRHTVFGDWGYEFDAPRITRTL